MSDTFSYLGTKTHFWYCKCTLFTISSEDICKLLWFSRTVARSNFQSLRWLLNSFITNNSNFWNLFFLSISVHFYIHHLPGFWVLLSLYFYEAYMFILNFKLKNIVFCKIEILTRFWSQCCFHLLFIICILKYTSQIVNKTSISFQRFKDVAIGNQKVACISHFIIRFASVCIMMAIFIPSCSRITKWGVLFNKAENVAFL